MAEYNYPKDGKIHTRYSELVRCTPGQIEKVVAERMGDIIPFSNDIMDFGTERHQILSDYIIKNNKLPKHFAKELKTKYDLELEIKGDQSERHIAVEMFKGIVIHGTPDIFGKDWIIDFKTTTRGKEAYINSKQNIFYAWLLSIYGLKIKRAFYLCELWNKERNEILGYESHDKEITEIDKDEIKKWAWERAKLLKSAIKHYQKVEV